MAVWSGARALGDGDALAMAGSLKVGVWQAKDGTHRPSMDMTITQVLTAHHVTKKRKAMQPEQPPSNTPMQRQARAGPAAGEFGDGIPLDF